MRIIGNNTKTEKIFALLYGQSGTGKTDFCGQLGTMGKVLVIDIDQGSVTLRTSSRVKKCLDNLTVVSFDTFGDLNTAYEAIQKNTPENWNRVFGIKPDDASRVDAPFDWIVWDSWSEIQWNMMQKLRDDKDLNSKRLDFRKNIEIQHWGMLTDLNKLSIEALRTLPINQVFIMLETMTKDEISGATIGGPAIHGKLVQEMPGYFNIVLRSYVDAGGKYIITSKPKGRYPSKTRLEEGKEVVNPTPEDFFTIK